MKTKFTNLKRFYKQILMIFSDQMIILFALILAFVLRFGDIGESFYYMSKNWWLFIIISLIEILLSESRSLFINSLPFTRSSTLQSIDK